VRTGVVQQQERAQRFTVRLVRKHRAYRETIANPVLTGCGINA
jgi:hypothetical protein